MIIPSDHHLYDEPNRQDRPANHLAWPWRDVAGRAGRLTDLIPDRACFNGATRTVAKQTLDE